MAVDGVKPRASRVGRGVVVKSLVRVVVLFVSGFLLYQAGLTVHHTMEKLGIVKNAESEVEALRLANLEVYIENREVTSDDHIETESRDRLNYSQDGEVLFVIDEGLFEDADLNIYIESIKSDQRSRSLLDKPVYLQWLDFFKGYLAD